MSIQSPSDDIHRLESHLITLQTHLQEQLAHQTQAPTHLSHIFEEHPIELPPYIVDILKEHTVASEAVFDTAEYVQKIIESIRSQISFLQIDQQIPRASFGMKHPDECAETSDTKALRSEDDDEAMSPLILALLRENYEEAKKLLALGADVNKVCSFGTMTALGVAIEKHADDIIPLLLEKGANVNVMHTHRLPLTLAIASHQDTLAQELLSHGAFVNPPNRSALFDTTPLRVALETHQEIMVRLLLTKGADVHVHVGDGQFSFLERAILDNRLDWIELILQSEADLNRPGFQAEPPLLFALRNATDINIVRLLISSHRCDLNQTGREQISPLTFAIGQNASSTVLLLLENGADVNRITYCPQTGTIMTPLLKAKVCDLPAIEEMLKSYGGDADCAERLFFIQRFSAALGSTGNIFFRTQDQVYSLSLEGGSDFYTTHVLKKQVSDFLNERVSQTLLGHEERAEVEEALQQAVNVKITMKGIEFSGSVSAEDIISDIRSRRPVFLPCVTPDHEFCIVFHEDKCMICNRARGQPEGIHAIEILAFDPEKLTPEILLTALQRCWQNETTPAIDFLCQTIGARRIGSLDQKWQKSGNCTWANLKSGFFALLYSILEHSIPSASERTTHARDIYKRFTSFSREKNIDELIALLQRSRDPELVEIGTQTVAQVLKKKEPVIPKESFDKLRQLLQPKHEEPQGFFARLLHRRR